MEGDTHAYNEAQFDPQHHCMTIPSSTLSAHSSDQGVVVVVDDDAHILRALVMSMQLKALNTATYASAEALLEDMEVRDGTIWVTSQTQKVPAIFCLIDLNLPCLNGFALARTLREAAPTLRMAITTASMEEDRAMQGQCPPGVPCLTKPFRLKELENLLNGHA